MKIYKFFHDPRNFKILKESEPLTKNNSVEVLKWNEYNENVFVS